MYRNFYQIELRYEGKTRLFYFSFLFTEFDFNNFHSELSKPALEEIQKLVKKPDVNHIFCIPHLLHSQKLDNAAG